ncbi:MAG TPA: hypothetical protein VM030_07575 [Acidimicrobiales bacterium]|nr:hypothetical protein [Acidimicrobiales bacterium]
MTTKKQQTVQEWFRSQVPDGWFTAPVEVTADAEEILVLGTLPDDAKVRAFREETRDARVRIAGEAEERFGRAVSWGVRSGGDDDAATYLFTHLNVPVMTRLRQRERVVLDTLVASGVARSRSEALAWCVRQVGERDAAWLDELRAALVKVDQVRATRPA